MIKIKIGVRLIKQKGLKKGAYYEFSFGVNGAKMA